MDKLEKYRLFIKQLIQEYRTYCPSYRGGKVDIELTGQSSYAQCGNVKDISNFLSAI